MGVPTAADAAVADPHAVPRLPLLLLSAGNEGDHKLTTSLLLEVAVVALPFPSPSPSGPFFVIIGS